MSSRILVITVLSAGLAALPMLASADTGGTPVGARPVAASTLLAQAGTTGTTGTGQGTSTGTGSGSTMGSGSMHSGSTGSGSMGSGSMGSGSMGSGSMGSGSMGSGSMGSGSMGSGSMGSGDFNPHNYRSTTDCLNAAAAAHAPFSACSTSRGR